MAKPLLGCELNFNMHISIALNALKLKVLLLPTTSKSGEIDALWKITKMQDYCAKL